MTTQEKLWEALATQGIPTDTAHCPHCGGMGRLTLDLKPGDPDFGKSFKCLCRHLQDESAAQERQHAALQARLIEQNERCGIPDEYRGFTLEGYVAYCRRMGKLRKVDGIYDSDPKKNPKAKRFEEISYADALAKRLKVMDSTAFSMCMDNKMPIIVFDLFKPHNLKRVVMGEAVGTVVTG